MSTSNTSRETRRPTRPLSMRWVDEGLLLFTLWTLCCHAVVLAGGSFRWLAVLFVLSLVVRVLWHRRQRAQAPGEASDTGPQLASDSPPAATPFTYRWQVLAAVISAAGTWWLASAEKPVILWWWTTGTLAIAALVCVLRWPATQQPSIEGRGPERWIWGLALACVLIALIAHRPDRDDSFYVNLAVAAVDHPGDALLAEDTLLGIEGLPVHLATYRLHSIELLAGFVSYVTPLPAIYSFHWVLSALGALLVPLALARLYRLLTPRSWHWSTLATLVVLVGAGEMHRWYGNFALVRMWQGKAWALFIFLPLIYAYAMEVGLGRGRAAWWRLAAAQVAAVGCSASAIWAGPVAALVALASVLRPVRKDLLRLGLGFLASGYVLFAGLLLKASMSNILGRAYEDMPLGEPLQAALGLALGDGNLQLLGLISLTSAWACLPKGLGQRFAIVAPFAVLVVLLNPYTAAWVVANLTGPSYWRGLWCLPLPLLIGLVLASPLRWLVALLRGRTAAWATWAPPAALAASLIAYWLWIPRFGGLSIDNRVELDWPRVKAPAVLYDWAGRLRAAVPPGTSVVAPSKMSAWVTTFHDHPFPVSPRPHYLRVHREVLGVEQVVHREVMTLYVDGYSNLSALDLGIVPTKEQAAELFDEGLDRFQVGAVCLRVQTPIAAQTRDILADSGYELFDGDRNFEIWLREDLIPPPPPPEPEPLVAPAADIDPAEAADGDQDESPVEVPEEPPQLPPPPSEPPFFAEDFEDGAPRELHRPSESAPSTVRP